MSTTWYFKPTVSGRTTNSDWSSTGNWWSSSDGTGTHPAAAPWTTSATAGDSLSLANSVNPTSYAQVDVDLGSSTGAFTITAQCNVILNIKIVDFNNRARTIYSGTYNNIIKNVQGSGVWWMIRGGTFNGAISDWGLNANSSTIYAGTFNNSVSKFSYITGGNFANATVSTVGNITGGTHPSNYTGIWAGFYYINGALGTGYYNGGYYVLGVFSTLDVYGNGFYNNLLYIGGVNTGYAQSTVYIFNDANGTHDFTDLANYSFGNGGTPSQLPGGSSIVYINIDTSSYNGPWDFQLVGNKIYINTGASYTLRDITISGNVYTIGDTELANAYITGHLYVSQGSTSYNNTVSNGITYSGFSGPRTSEYYGAIFINGEYVTDNGGWQGNYYVQGSIQGSGVVFDKDYSNGKYYVWDVQPVSPEINSSSTFAVYYFNIPFVFQNGIQTSNNGVFLTYTDYNSDIGYNLFINGQIATGAYHGYYYTATSANPDQNFTGNTTDYYYDPTGSAQYFFYRGMSPAIGALYVSTTGDDTTGNGSIQYPFRTAQFAYNIAQNAPTTTTVVIHFSAGTFDGINLCYLGSYGQPSLDWFSNIQLQGAGATSSFLGGIIAHDVDTPLNIALVSNRTINLGYLAFTAYPYSVPSSGGNISLTNCVAGNIDSFGYPNNGSSWAGNPGGIQGGNGGNLTLVNSAVGAVNINGGQGSDNNAPPACTGDPNVNPPGTGGFGGTITIDNLSTYTSIQNSQGFSGGQNWDLYGCRTVGADNYCPNATQDDLCNFSCQDPLGCGTDDNGNCKYIDSSTGNCTSNINYGCCQAGHGPSNGGNCANTDAYWRCADNFDQEYYSWPNGGCWSSIESDNCGNCGNYHGGCTDTNNATNGDACANYDDASCIYWNCNDPSACNNQEYTTGNYCAPYGCDCKYNDCRGVCDGCCADDCGNCGNGDTYDDCNVYNGCCHGGCDNCGNCGGINGCTNTNACNHTPGATCDDGSCVDLSDACHDSCGSCICGDCGAGCGSDYDECGNCNLYGQGCRTNCDACGNCDQAHGGCLNDIHATNYDSCANYDDGSCISIQNQCGTQNGGCWGQHYTDILKDTFTGVDYDHGFNAYVYYINGWADEPITTGGWGNTHYNGQSHDLFNGIDIDNSILTYDRETKLLLNFNGSLKDSSHYNWKFTNNGDAVIQNSVSKFAAALDVHGGGQIQATIPDSSFMFPGDFTIECYFYYTGFSNDYGALINGNNNADYSGFLLGFLGNGTFGFIATTGNPGDRNCNITITAQYDEVIDQWRHVAVVRRNSIITLYLDGNAIGSQTNYGVIIPVSNITIGCYNYYDGGTTRTTDGYISDVRVTKGKAIYTSNFTPSTYPLELQAYNYNDAVLLMDFNGDFSDSSSYNRQFNNNGAIINTSVKKFGTGSLYVNSGNGLTVGSDAALGFAADFTIECWLWLNNTNGYQWFINTSANGADATGWNLYVEQNNSIQFIAHNANDPGGAGWNILVTNNAPVPYTQDWFHLAVTRQDGVIRMFINGAQTSSDISGDPTLPIYQGDQLQIGNYIYTAIPLDGYIDGIRILNGYAAYTSNFTPPTQPFNSGSNLKYWVDGVGAGSVNLPLVLPKARQVLKGTPYANEVGTMANDPLLTYLLKLPISI